MPSETDRGFIVDKETSLTLLPQVLKTIPVGVVDGKITFQSQGVDSCREGGDEGLAIYWQQCAHAGVVPDLSIEMVYPRRYPRPVDDSFNLEANLEFDPPTDLHPDVYRHLLCNLLTGGKSEEIVVKIGAADYESFRGRDLDMILSCGYNISRADLRLWSRSWRIETDAAVNIESVRTPHLELPALRQHQFSLRFKRGSQLEPEAVAKMISWMQELESTLP